jgi:putative endonuclease
MASERGDGRQARGKAGEAAAQTYLERHGFKIIDANVRFGKNSGLIGELDIVAWDGPTLCFVEVKTRRGRVGRVAPVEAVTPSKQRQIAQLATAYAAQHGLLSGDVDVPMRFDVIAVTLAPGPDEAVRHIQLLRGAFLAPDD